MVDFPSSRTLANRTVAGGTHCMQTSRTWTRLFSIFGRSTQVRPHPFHPSSAEIACSPLLPAFYFPSEIKSRPFLQRPKSLQLDSHWARMSC